MTSVQELRAEATAPAPADEGIGIQPGGYLLELSLDWVVLRASENVHRLLGRSHASVVNEPLGEFVHSQALHDLRNLFSRLSGTTGIARAYRVRLMDEPDLHDVAFQLSDGRVLLEAVPCAEGHYGEAFGTVGGLIAGLEGTSGQALLDGGARRMRALTGHDRATLTCGEIRAESSRGSFAGAPPQARLPAIVADCEEPHVAVYPRKTRDTSIAEALMAAPDANAAEQLRSAGVRASLTIPFSVGGVAGEFRCESRVPNRPSFEVHAAAELYAQLFALRVEIDRLKGG